MEMREFVLRALDVSAVALLFTWLLRLSMDGHVQFEPFDLVTLLTLWLGVAFREVARFYR